MQELKRLKRKIWWLRVKLAALVVFAVLTWWFMSASLASMDRGEPEKAVFQILTAVFLGLAAILLNKLTGFARKEDDD